MTFPAIMANGVKIVSESEENNSANLINDNDIASIFAI
jgi:hypothetical protein